MSHPLLTSLDQQLRQLSDRGLRRQRRITDSPCAPVLQTGDRAVLTFCSNDYLGLASHPAVVDALREGASLYGAGSGASHLISGHSRAHDLLEDRLAGFLRPHIDNADALYFGTGYMANLAMLSALANRDTTLFCEALNHASLIDGARLSRAQVQVYPHRAVDQLDDMLAASTAANKIVVTDGVFSMDGDLAPLPELLALCEQHNAWLLVDDAHGFGVLGTQGRGILAHFGMSSSRIIYMGTLGKAAGVGGAFVAAHATVIDWLIQRARPYIYTTAPPPALAHALMTCLDIIAGPHGDERRLHLQNMIARFKSGLRFSQWQNPESTTPIQPIIIGTNAATMNAAEHLFTHGLWVGAIRPPTVPVNTARLRVTLSASHTINDVDRLISGLNQFDKEADA